MLIIIYSYNDKDLLFKLIQGTYKQQFSEEILDLLTQGKLKKKNLKFNNEENLIIFQKNIFPFSKSKEQVEIIIKLSEGLTGNLKFIEKYCEKICKFLEDNRTRFSSNKTNYTLNLDNPRDNEDIDEIYILLNKIINKTKDKPYDIIDYNCLFKNLIDIYYLKDLEIFCKLHNFVEIFNTQKARLIMKNLKDFYDKVHEKGINLIKTKN